MKEQWKRIWYKGQVLNFEVSDRGRIRNINNGRIKTQHRNHAGYQFTNIYLPSVKRVRLVLIAGLIARAFLGPKPKGQQIDHINGIKHDNRIKNLRFISQADNIRRSYDDPNRTRCCDGSKNLSPATYRRIRKAWKSGKYSQCQLARAFQLHNSTISKIVNKVYEGKRGTVEVFPDWTKLDPRGQTRKNNKVAA